MSVQECGGGLGEPPMNYVPSGGKNRKVQQVLREMDETEVTSSGKMASKMRSFRESSKIASKLAACMDEESAAAAAAAINSTSPADFDDSVPSKLSAMEKELNSVQQLDRRTASKLSAVSSKLSAMSEVSSKLSAMAAEYEKQQTSSSSTSECHFDNAPSKLSSTNAPSKLSSMGDCYFDSAPSKLSSTNAPSKLSSMGDCHFDSSPSKLSSTNAPSKLSSMGDCHFDSAPSKLSSMGDCHFDSSPSKLSSTNAPSKGSSMGDCHFDSSPSKLSSYTPAPSKLSSHEPPASASTSSPCHFDSIPSKRSSPGVVVSSSPVPIPSKASPFSLSHLEEAAGSSSAGSDTQSQTSSAEECHFDSPPHSRHRTHTKDLKRLMKKDDNDFVAGKG